MTGPRTPGKNLWRQREGGGGGGDDIALSAPSAALAFLDAAGVTPTAVATLDTLCVLFGLLTVRGRATGVQAALPGQMQRSPIAADKDGPRHGMDWQHH